jgi:hypothetical protein
MVAAWIAGRQLPAELVAETTAVVGLAAVADEGAS